MGELVHERARAMEAVHAARSCSSAIDGRPPGGRVSEVAWMIADTSEASRVLVQSPDMSAHALATCGELVVV